MSTVVFLKNYIKNKSIGMLHATGTAIQQVRMQFHL